VIYRPPNNDSEAVTYMTTLVKCLSKYESNKYANVLVGDLNLPKVDWSANTGPNHEVY